MTDNEIAGRLVALEVVSMTALGLYLANSRNDPDYAKATALLEFLRGSILSTAQNLSSDLQVEAGKYGEHLVSTLAKNLKNMRGEGVNPTSRLAREPVWIARNA